MSAFRMICSQVCPNSVRGHCKACQFRNYLRQFIATKTTARMEILLGAHINNRRMERNCWLEQQWLLCATKQALLTIPTEHCTNNLMLFEKYHCKTPSSTSPFGLWLFCFRVSIAATCQCFFKPDQHKIRGVCVCHTLSLRVYPPNLRKQ